MKKLLCLITAIFAALTLCRNACAYVIPKEDSGIKYFYVFGPEGDIFLGAEPEHKVSFYFDVPEDEVQGLVIGIYDPDTGGRHDYRAKYEEPWKTITEFSVYGNRGALLDKRSFGEGTYDRKFYEFGPYSREQGEKIGNSYRFRLDVEATEGPQGNLFSINVAPDSVEAFSYKFTFRLLEREGQKMYLYPQLPAGSKEIVVENYDLDINGGSSYLFDPHTNQILDIKDSESGEWAKTVIPISIEHTERFKYIITKKTQNRANAGVMFKDDKGNLLPVYFRPSEKEVVAMPPKPQPKKIVKSGPDCREFIFDATESYDPDNQELSYHWDFGDGSSSTEPVASHLYAKGGQYTVTLSVRDTSGLECDTATTQETLIVNSPPLAAFIAPALICHNQEIAFDASPTTDNTPDQLTYRWDFGDGTSAEGKQVNKAYKKGGAYNVLLTVNDNAGTTCSIGTMEKEVIVNEPPIISDFKDVEMCIPLNEEYKVAFNFIPSGRNRATVKAEWDFGDGIKAQGNSITHIYKQGGEYTVKLLVNDGLGLPCSTAEVSFRVSLHKQPVADAGEDIRACIGADIIFDGSGSRGEDPAKLTYAWDFGDGTSKTKGIRVRHTYKDPGVYKVTLAVSEPESKKCVESKDVITVLVNAKPSITLKEAGKYCVGDEVDFATILNTAKPAELSKAGLEYAWSFGDGTSVKAGSSTSHVYNKGGEYTVSVTVDDKLDTPCSVDTQAIKVKVNTPPLANSGPNLVCCVDKKSLFDASSSYDADGDSLSYAWDFGDGDTATGVKVGHVYKKIGKYTVTLTVDDGSQTRCNQAKSSFEVIVNEQPVSVIKVREGK